MLLAAIRSFMISHLVKEAITQEVEDPAADPALRWTEERRVCVR